MPIRGPDRTPIDTMGTEVHIRSPHKRTRLIMAKGPDWNDVHRANPGAVRDALAEPDIPFDDAPLAQPGNGETYLSE
jgi:hypothetical protein